MLALMAIGAESDQVFRAISGLFSCAMMSMKRPNVIDAAMLARKATKPDYRVGKTHKAIFFRARNRLIINSRAFSRAEPADAAIHLLATEHQVAAQKTRLSLNTLAGAILPIFARQYDLKCLTTRTAVYRFSRHSAAGADPGTVNLADTWLGIVSEKLVPALRACVHASMMGAL